MPGYGRILLAAAPLLLPTCASAREAHGLLGKAAGLADAFSLLVLPFIVKASFLFMSAITLLVLCLLLIKLTATAWEADIRRARKWMLPIIERHLADTSRELPRRLFRTRWPLRRVLQYVVIHRSFGETGQKLADIAAAYGRLGFVDSDLRRLWSPFWWVRAEAARCLGQMKAERAKAALLARLNDRATEVRLVAAWALGRIGDTAAIGPILNSLVKTSRMAGMRLSSTVFELGGRAVGPLVGCLEHPDPAVAILALHLLGELGDKSALPGIRKMAAPGRDLEVRLAAYKAIGTIADGSSRKILEQSLSDPLWQVRAQAARGLGLIGDPGSVAGLVKALSDGKWWVRRNAGEALVKTGEKGVAALRRALNAAPRSPGGRMAAQWLDEYGYPA